jgi:predicted Zn-dependent peptidase
MKSSISLGLESVMNRMTRLGKTILMYDEVVSPEEIIAKVYAVNPDMVQEMAKRMFKPELFSIAVIGNEEALPMIRDEFQKMWGGK